MADQLQLRGGTTAEHSTFTGALREVTVDTTKDTLVVHDNATVGGHPLAKEDLSNVAAATAASKLGNQTVAFNAGAAGTPSVTFNGDTNTGTFSPGSDTWAISTGGSERLRVDSSGRLGIGTSSLPGWHSNYKVLHVGTQASATSYVGQSLLLAANAYDDGPGTWKYVGTNFATRYSQDPSSGTHSWAVASSGTAGGAVTWNTAMYIDSSSRVGIGTTAPGCALDVVSQTVPQLRVRYTSGGNYVSLLHNDSDAYLDTTAGGLVFRTSTSTERARIDSSGRLLLGTSTATAVTDGNVSAQLEVEGTTTATSAISIIRNSNDTNAGGLIIAKSRGTTAGSNTAVSSGDELGFIQFQGADGTQKRIGASIGAFADAATGANDLPSRLVFSTCPDSGSSPVERMRITQAGNTLIGSGSQISSERLGITFAAGNQGIALNVASGAAQTQILFANPNGTVGTISTSGSATAYNTSSDYRLKENVTSVTDGIARLQQLKPSRFNFIADPDKTVDGFIAHEVQAVVPEAITGEKDAVDADGKPVYQGIDQSKLVPLLTAALQEAVAEINALKDRVAALEGA